MKIKVNRKISPQKMLEETGYTLYVNKDVVATMHKGEGKEVEIEFFKVGKYISDDDLEKEYQSRGLVPASPYDMLAVPKEKLDEMKYVGTHWKNSGDGKWCFSAFRRWGDGGRRVSVHRLARADEWHGRWWFAGLRKLPLGPSSLVSESLDSFALRISALEKFKEQVEKMLNLPF